MNDAEKIKRDQQQLHLERLRDKKRNIIFENSGFASFIYKNRSRVSVKFGNGN